MYIWNEQKRRKKLIDDVLFVSSQGPNSIKRKDGFLFAIQLAPKAESPFNVKSIDLGLSAAEIIDIIREIRER